MDRPGCEWCDAPADVVDNHDTPRCWDCWNDGGPGQAPQPDLPGSPAAGRCCGNRRDREPGRRLMAEWHWYFDQHGQIDRTVQIRQYGTRTEGRCRCGTAARWAERPSVPAMGGDEQLALFRDRS